MAQSASNLVVFCPVYTWGLPSIPPFRAVHSHCPGAVVYPEGIHDSITAQSASEAISDKLSDPTVVEQPEKLAIWLLIDTNSADARTGKSDQDSW